MVGKWHDLVVEILNELCEEWVKADDYKKVYDGNSTPIPITYKTQTCYYRPDLYAVYRKNEKVDIFEVIDTETEGEAVMDIMYSALTPRLCTVSLVFSNESKLEKVNKHAGIVLNKAFNEESKPYWETFDGLYLVHVPRRARNHTKIKRQLKRELEF